MQQIHQVLLCPFVEEEVIAIGHFRAFPAVKGFGHQHHTHLVAGLHQFGGGHVVRGADGIAAHVLQDAYLSADAGYVGDAAQGAEVVVVAYAFEDCVFSVQEEAFVGDELYGADAEAGGVLVLQRVALVDFGFSRVEGGTVRAPQGGLVHHEVLFETLAGKAGLQIDLGKVSVYLGGGQLCAPGRDVGVFVDDQVYVAVQPGAGIPAGRLVLIFQTDGQGVGAFGLEVGRHVEVERVVAIGPIAHFLSVEPYAGVAHGTVEDQRGCLSLSEFRCFEVQAIPACAYERQAAGASGMFHGFLLAVLRDGQVLFVVLDAERAVDGPVVGHGHRLPFGIVERLVTELLLVFSGEFPPFLERLFDTHLLCANGL